MAGTTNQIQTPFGTGVRTALAVNTNSTGGFPVETDGTFTPAINVGGSTVGVTYSSRTAVYSRIGNVVTFNIFIITSSLGGLTGNISITGMPVAGRATSNNYQTFPINLSGGTLTGIPMAIINQNTTTLIFYQYTGGATQAFLNATNVPIAAQIVITGSYLCVV
jgi:hypothetical protein